MKQSDGYFITGTDTDVGKTWVTIALMRAFQSKGLSVQAMKPVSAGCQWIDDQWKNDDARLMQRYGSRSLSYAEINPYAFELPVSPHLAAAGSKVDMQVLVEGCRHLQQLAETVLVEGAGGWYSPLSEWFNNADLAVALKLPVVMVVAVRLGCINHALLTATAIKDSGLNCAGWIAVKKDAMMVMAEENIQYLEDKIEFPLLGTLPFSAEPDFDKLSLNLLTAIE